MKELQNGLTYSNLSNGRSLKFIASRA